MSAKDGGYFSRLVRKLTSDVEELDADEMSMRSGAEGAQRAQHTLALRRRAEIRHQYAAARLAIRSRR